MKHQQLNLLFVYLQECLTSADASRILLPLVVARQGLQEWLCKTFSVKTKLHSVTISTQI